MTSKNSPVKSNPDTKKNDKPDTGAAVGSPPTPPPDNPPEANEQKPPVSTPPAAPEKESHIEQPAADPIQGLTADIMPLISEAVVKTLNKMNLADQIKAGIDQAVKAQLEPLLAQAKAMSVAGAADGGAEGAPAVGGTLGGGMLETILMSLFKNSMGGNNGGGGMAQMAEMFKGMQSFQEMAYSFYSAPRDQAMKEMTGMLKLALQAGADPKDLPGALEKSIKQP
jgi:hypothetical protein